MSDVKKIKILRTLKKIEALKIATMKLQGIIENENKYTSNYIRDIITGLLELQADELKELEVENARRQTV